VILKTQDDGQLTYFSLVCVYMYCALHEHSFTKFDTSYLD